jgi:menaquinone-9 beta-reductase
MPAPQPITIVGGGLAGLTLGIGLRRRGIPVTIYEAGHYPRHRVCGEFISGNGPAVLARLGLRGRFDQAGAIEAVTARFIAGDHHSPVRKLPVPALCLSRNDMDALLAREFQQLGGELRENARWTAGYGEGIVRASGRRAHATDRGWRWFGLKAHARNVRLAADLEMHVTPAGYIGVSRINHGAVNVCGLFRSRPGEAPPDSKLQWLRGKPGSLLHDRLADAQFDGDSFCAVAGLSLQLRRATAADGCCIGDARTMIPPVTGNGMSMAFESAEIASEPLAAFSRGQLSWDQSLHTIARASEAAFGRRLRWAGFLQWLMFASVLQSGAGAGLLRSDWLWQLLFAKTR